MRKRAVGMQQRQQLLDHLERRTGEAGHCLDGLEMTRLVLEPKEALIISGPPHEHLYLILDGMLQLCVTPPDTEPRPVCFYQSGQCVVPGGTLGHEQPAAGADQETAQHDGGLAEAAPLTLTAIGRTQLLQLRADQVNQRVLTDLKWARFAIGHFMTTSHQLERQLLDLTLLSREEHYMKLARSAPGLLENARAKDIAALLGITPEALSRIKARLRNAEEHPA